LWAAGGSREEDIIWCFMGMVLVEGFDISCQCISLFFVF
jgi:hypothetical protein